MTVPVVGVQALGLVSMPLVWGIINDAQSANWTPVNDSQVGTWTPVNDASTVVWTEIAT